MKVLLLNGSPHKEGCTNIALQEIASILQTEGIETEIYWVGNRPISGCIACGKCISTGKCCIDDTVNPFIEKAREADAYIFGSPVHYAAASGSITSFLDRAFYGKSAIYALKPAAAIVSCRRGGASAAFDQLNKYFTISQMLVVGSQYWNQIHGNTPDEAKQDEEGLQTMRTLARNMAWILRCIEQGRQAGITPPQREIPIKTNFIR